MGSALEAARKEWRAGTAARPMHTAMTLTEDGLVLGSGTALARTSRVGGLALEGSEQRILALLSVAYGKSVEGGVIDKVRLASDYWSRGETTLALIALAHSGLPALPDPEEASFRLFLADRALADGVSPDELIEACRLSPTPRDLDKAAYNPNQPRVPAGSLQGGEWTPAGGNPITPAPPLADRTAAGVARRKYQRVKEPPADAKMVIPPDGVPIVGGDPPKPLIAPPSADFRQVYAAGQAIVSLPPTEQYRRARAAIAQEGTYDFQRDVAQLKFYSAYTPAANYAVGVYMAGAGYSLLETLTFAKIYAFGHSSNYKAQDREDWITRGWNDAHFGRWR